MNGSSFGDNSGVVRRYLDVSDERFYQSVHTALARYGEVLILHRPNGVPLGPHLEWFLIRDIERLADVLHRCRPGSIVHVWLTPKLPLRGVGSRALQAAFTARLTGTWRPDGEAHPDEVNLRRLKSGPYLFFTFDRDQASYEATGMAADLHPPSLAFFSGREDSWVRRWFYEHLGQYVAIGLYPRISLPNGTEAVAAMVPRSE